MAYQTPITIKEAIDRIRKKQYVLPSIQREFVWDTDQIETLFDSLMRDYPISTFLFWQVDKGKIKDFQFYEFLNHYHQKKRTHNEKADLGSDESVIALLDGQQRLTSLYIALTGSYAKKAPYYSWDSENGFPVKRLYLNLLKPSDELEAEYDFKFLTEEEFDEKKDGSFWFRCGDVLAFDEPSKVSDYLVDNDLLNTAIYSKEESKFANNTLNLFANVVHQKGTISYYLEKGEELDKVLQIFIRINSGGTKLSYSDLLLSIATAQWEERDAREVIHEFVDEINGLGDGFNFNKDIVLKACLVLSDFDVKFMVDNFTKENMAVIEQNWDKISSAMRSAIQLIAKFGYSRDNLRATNTVIPIAYYIYKNGFGDKILHSGSREADRLAIKEWLARVLLKGTFGGQPDSIYPKMRDLINENTGEFPLRQIIEYYKGRRKSIAFSEDDIDNLLDQKYGHAITFSTLSLLYPGLNKSFKYHQDHIHPKSLFKKKLLKKEGMSDEKIDKYLARVNELANLQLMQETQNIEKSAKPFADWLSDTYPGKADQDSFLLQNHITAEMPLDFDRFNKFYKLRRALLRKKLAKLLRAGGSQQT
ncbi:DUF262 domain-containing protein [Pontixanthobacter luteolus]|uniref:DUF262 domain-containing protein n=1 Tax=Pontixanthobacter luteolus TaxID=295089 RepID=UPI002302974C|nr:DUF262 domain-containing protein [Pontixanthobacter luteolus]